MHFTSNVCVAGSSVYMFICNFSFKIIQFGVSALPSFNVKLIDPILFFFKVNSTVKRTYQHFEWSIK